MGKKKKNRQDRSARTSSFQANPFSHLKGFAVSETEPEKKSEPVSDPVEEEPIEEDLFAREMSMLGVKRVNQGASVERPATDSESNQDRELHLSDQDEFLAAMGDLPVHFEDQFPEENGTRQASPRRLKLLKQGRLKPEATLDLHGLYRQQVAEKISFFLQDAKYQGYQTLLIVTGRGLHSQGEPVLRAEAERFLREECRTLLSEWARAPRQYGGEGALIVFLKG